MLYTFVAFWLIFWLVFSKPTPGPHKGSEPGAGVRERKGRGSWRGDDAEDLRHVCDLQPEILTVGRAVGLVQELYGIDLYNARSMYAPWGDTSRE